MYCSIMGDLIAQEIEKLKIFASSYESNEIFKWAIGYFTKAEIQTLNRIKSLGKLLKKFRKFIWIEEMAGVKNQVLQAKLEFN